MGGYAQRILSRWVRGNDSMLGQVRALFLTLCLIWTLVGLAWADLDAPGQPYVTVGAVAVVLVPLVDINQTMLNLIINAAHAIESADRGRGRIHITTRVEEDHAVIEVADTGTGVPAEIADKLFDPFFTTKDVGAGIGQGLALVRTLVVDRHGGEIDFAGEPGAGTTFRVRLPLQDTATPHRDEHIMEAAA